MLQKQGGNRVKTPFSGVLSTGDTTLNLVTLKTADPESSSDNWKATKTVGEV
ncbi:MAG: hypothetical protein IPH82_25455 [Chloroflexi bacterium]|nr:hypothetical protein [Chloroflexota bacterium]